MTKYFGILKFGAKGFFFRRTRLKEKGKEKTKAIEKTFADQGHRKNLSRKVNTHQTQHQTFAKKLRTLRNEQLLLRGKNY